MTYARLLRDRTELDDAARAARERDLPPATDYRKHWDNLLALDAVSETDGPVADLGCRSGLVLTWLHHTGRGPLYGCDVRKPWPPAWKALQQRQAKTVAAAVSMYAANRGRMRRAPAEDTGFPTGIFGAVTSMSVIEHHVDTPRFFAEAHRLLRPGGLLFISTDYWPEGGRTDDGVVFSAEDVERLRRESEDAGLGADPAPDLSAGGDPVIGSYTFLTLSFRKPAG